MIKRLANVTFMGGLAVAVLAPALAGTVSAMFGRDVRLMSPHAPDVVQVNKLSWSKGEPVAEIYGIPSENPIRVVFADKARIVVPEEDASLTLYSVNKQAGENPLQAQTLWFLAEIAVAVGVVLGGAGFAVRSHLRARASAPARAIATRNGAAVVMLGLLSCGAMSGCQARERAEQASSENDPIPARTTYHVGHDVKFINIRLEAESDLESLAGFTNHATGEVVVQRETGLDSIKLSIPAASLATGVEGRDAQLQAWLEAKKFPEIQLTSRSVKRAPTGNDRFDVSGELTLHGVTRPIAAAVEAAPVAETAMNRSSLPEGHWLRLSTELRLKTSDFGVSGSDFPDVWTLKLVIFAGTARVDAE